MGYRASMLIEGGGAWNIGWRVVVVCGYIARARLLIGQLSDKSQLLQLLQARGNISMLTTFYTYKSKYSHCTDLYDLAR